MAPTLGEGLRWGRGIWGTLPRSLVSQGGVTGTKEMNATKRERAKRVTRTKKGKKRLKKYPTAKTKKRKNFALEGLGRDRSGDLPKRLQSLPFGPEVSLSSGYTSEQCPTIVLSTLYPQNGLGKDDPFFCTTNCTTVLPP